jgi:acetolactate synthase I/II/III large subunit
MRVADYIAEAIAGLGVGHVFLVTGGGAMHLDDALGLREDLDLVFCHHEQACAIAVEGYARTRGGIGVASVTTGPGGTNAITGVLGQWHDSVPALYVSGQVKRETTVASTHLPLRQLGDQEADIVRLVAPITKYAVSVTDPESVRYHFEKAVWLAVHGRPGPVWLDVPLDVQGADVAPECLRAFDPSRDDDTAAESLSPARADRFALSPWPEVTPAVQAAGALRGTFDRDAACVAARETLRRLAAAERPVILVGSAVRASGALDVFQRVAELLGAPLCTAWNAGDAVAGDHPLFVGRPGSLGDRPGNFAVQNSDVALVVGCRLNVRQVGYEFAAFAHHAFRIVVDIDEAELAKPTISPDLPVHADVRFFLEELERLALADPPSAHGSWVDWCRERRRRYPVIRDVGSPGGPVDPYRFVARLADHLGDGDVVVCANGSACVVTIQAFVFKARQRLLVNSGTAGMGYDLPAAVGAAFARRAQGGRVICLAGDGSIQMNLQELQTIAQHRLPVKVFVFDNEGYASIRQTQDNLFAGHRVGEGPGSGVTFPDLVAVAGAYGIDAVGVTRHDELDQAVATALVSEGPALVNVAMDPERTFTPRIMAERRPDGTLVSKPLEDMYPFLDREEFSDNMIGPLYAPGER